VRGKRVVFVAMLPLLIALVTVLIAATAGGADRTSAYGVFTGELLLLSGAGAGRARARRERLRRRAGRAHPRLLLATTLSRPRIVLTKYAAAAAVTWLACLPATLGCMVLATRTELPLGEAAGSLLLASALGALAYSALFVLLSLVLRRAVLVGLAYLVLWEGLLAGTAVAFRNLSVGAYAARVAGAPFDEIPFDAADASVAGSVVVLLAVAVGGVAAAARRLPRAHL
jgi:ABC-2 type transport system permease protein